MGRELQQGEGQVADVNIKFRVDALRMTGQTIRQPLYVPLPTCFSPLVIELSLCVRFLSTNIFLYRLIY